MRVTVRRSGNGISSIVRDLEATPGKIQSQGGALVHRNGERLNRLARNIARAKAGPHGANYFKRISAEMTGPLSVEVGPSPLQGERYVGVDAPGGPGRDLDEALAKVRPKFYDDASDLMDRLL